MKQSSTVMYTYSSIAKAKSNTQYEVNYANMKQSTN